jgi:hypothetical protein
VVIHLIGMINKMYILVKILVIAQEIEAVLPELVVERDNGYKAVKYEKLVALLIEGIKDQQNKIDNQQEQINELKTLIKN